jgi:hypothetical protein
MNTRNLAILAVVAVLVGGGIFYFVQSPAPEPAKVAEAPKPAAPAPAAPKPAAPQAVAAPKLPAAPAPAPAAKPAPAAPAAAAPNAEAIKELDTTLNDMASMLQAGDMAGLMEKYMPPQEQARMTPEMKAQMQQAMQSPQMQQQLQMMAQALQSLQGQTPTFNDAGDTATYQMTPPAGMIPPGVNAPATIPVTFIKVDGRWYAGNNGGGF